MKQVAGVRSQGRDTRQTLQDDLALQYVLIGKIDRFESIYSVLCRFASLNSLSGQAIRSLFKSESRARKGGVVSSLENLSSVNTVELERSVGATQSQVFEMFLVPSYTLNALICPYLRFCPICISARKHYAIFQWEWLAACPFHAVRLRAACVNCGSAIIYKWASELFDSPFCCPRCQVSLGAQQGRVGYFDVYNRARFHAIDSIYTRLRGVPSPRGADTCRTEPLIGFLVFCPTEYIAERWYHMAELPLEGLSLDEVNWRHNAGYIQVRGLSPKTRKQAITAVTLDRSGLVRDLLCCLKAILRNLRRIRRREQSQSLAATIYPSDQELQRKEAYRLLQQCWCGKVLRGRYTRDGMMQIIEAWLDRQIGDACKPQCFIAVIPWLVTHLFCGQVVDSIATASQIVDAPPELLNGFSMDLAIVRCKPLWYVALTVYPSVISYRVIHHYQYPSSLWSPAA